MEEQILKIMKSHCVFKIWPVNAAKETTEHVMKFIEWLGENCSIVQILGNRRWKYDDGKTCHYCGDMKMYQYWFENVYKSK
jgi:hypothetical protein